MSSEVRVIGLGMLWARNLWNAMGCLT